VVVGGGSGVVAWWLDGRKVLGLKHTALVLAIGKWARKVFASLEKGLKVLGGGGLHEAKLRRATAGVLLKVDELASKWLTVVMTV